MTVLVVGGAGSGKSAYAEELILRLKELRSPRRMLADGESGQISRLPRSGGRNGELSGRSADDRPLIYLATMRPFGEEAAARIEKHRAQRAGRGFATVERFTALGALDVPEHAAVLLEDVGNLCANEMFDASGTGDGAADAVVRGVESLQKRCDTLVLVSNEAGSGGAAYAGDTPRYLRMLGVINQRLAALSDAVCEVVCGVPIYHKGEEPR